MTDTMLLAQFESNNREHERMWKTIDEALRQSRENDREIYCRLNAIEETLNDGLKASVAALQVRAEREDEERRKQWTRSETRRKQTLVAVSLAFLALVGNILVAALF